MNVSGFAALGGNLVVVFLMARTLRFLTRSITEQKNTIVNTLLILNLSISDLLVSVSEFTFTAQKCRILSFDYFHIQVYILAVCGKSLSVEGKYCFADREWRSSIECSMLGVLLVVGSEESVFTMVLITAMRMRTVLR